MATSFARVARKEDIAPGTGKTVDVNGTPVALFNVGGSFYAIHNTCRHRQGPLGEGRLSASEVTCPWHGWQYDVTTGKCITNPAVSIPRFEVKVEGEDVLVASEASGG